MLHCMDYLGIYAVYAVIHTITLMVSWMICFFIYNHLNSLSIYIMPPLW